MALTNTSTAAGGLGRTIGDAVIAFNHSNVMYPLVTVKQAARGSNHVQFSDWTKLTSGEGRAATKEKERREEEKKREGGEREKREKETDSYLE